MRSYIVPKKLSNAAGQVAGGGIDSLNTEVRIGVSESKTERRVSGEPGSFARRSRRVV